MQCHDAAGETLSYSAADHVQALNDHMDRPFIDTIFVNNKEIPEEIKAKYAEEQAQPVQFDTDALKAMGLEVIPGEIITYDQHVIRHDTLKVASLLVDLLQQKKIGMGVARMSFASETKKKKS
ncbi:hypothetical protein BsIDN1_60880 [Bacillus safensis]|uniref:Uncharacterized protein n=1 Tax=Bacillus safensis TaxID=561879 RepID=A0A5S9MG62_BACIA|nr:hypothetical protein BsIDN1_60880 [Bacillus safensis]